MSLISPTSTPTTLLPLSSSSTSVIITSARPSSAAATAASAQLSIAAAAAAGANMVIAGANAEEAFTHFAQLQPSSTRTTTADVVVPEESQQAANNDSCAPFYPSTLSLSTTAQRHRFERIISGTAEDEPSAFSSLIPSSPSLLPFATSLTSTSSPAFFSGNACDAIKQQWKQQQCDGAGQYELGLLLVPGPTINRRISDDGLVPPPVKRVLLAATQSLPKAPPPSSFINFTTISSEKAVSIFGTAPPPPDVISNREPLMADERKPTLSFRRQRYAEGDEGDSSSSADERKMEERSGKKKKIISPFAPEAIVPLPFQLDEFGSLGTTIWKRNERERYRVRCVNEGYERLRSRLPLVDNDRRLSKVDTLRMAISYIHHLQRLLRPDGGDSGGDAHCDLPTALCSCLSLSNNNNSSLIETTATTKHKADGGSGDNNNVVVVVVDDERSVRRTLGSSSSSSAPSLPFSSSSSFDGGGAD